MTVDLKRKDGSIIGTGKSIRSLVEQYKEDLNEASLKDEILDGISLDEANVRNADLSGASLVGANLYQIDLTGSDLSNVDLTGANLYEADLRKADLTNANFEGANLYGAALSDATGIQQSNQNVILPEGTLIGWKKAYVPESSTSVIMKLQIPSYARRSNATGRKCRCDRALVLSINSIETGQEYWTAHSLYDHNFVYHTGMEVVVEDYDEDRWNECSVGIHFFITREEAIAYND